MFRVEELNGLVKKVLRYRDTIDNESQTRTSLIEPLLTLLGYDVANPTEVLHEYSCDVGTKRGEKVDYVLKLKDKIVLLIEAKDCRKPLNNDNISQLFRYFSNSSANLAMLTNGIEYMFFSDTMKQNIMDLKPFYTLDVLNLKTEDVDFLQNLTKENFNLRTLSQVAQVKTLRSVFTEVLREQAENPTEKFVKFLMSNVEGYERNSVKNGLVGLSEALLEVFNTGSDTKSEDTKVLNKTTLTTIQPSGEFNLNDVKIYTSDTVSLPKPASVEILGVTYNVSSWAEVIVRMASHGVEHTVTLDTFLQEFNWVNIEKGLVSRPLLVETQQGDFYITGNASSKLHLKRIVKIADLMGYPYNKVKITLS